MTLWPALLVLFFGNVLANDREGSESPSWLEEMDGIYFKMSKIDQFVELREDTFGELEKKFTLAENSRARHERVFRKLLSPESLLGLNGSAFGAGSYSIIISLGSPSQTFNVVVDTGSDLFWVPCECIQCSNSSSFLPLSKPYNPAASVSHAAPSCLSPVCKGLEAQQDNSSFGCSAANITDYKPTNLTGNPPTECEYTYNYWEGYSTSGLILEDNITLPLASGETLSVQVIVGCGRYQSGLLSEAEFGFDGIIGLGKSSFSVPSRLAAQTAMKATFTLCLEGASQGGHLVLGQGKLPAYSAIVSVPSSKTGQWELLLQSIEYNGSVITSQAGETAVFDSGTPYTTLPANAFQYLESQITSQLGTTPLTSSVAVGLTCYQVSTQVSLTELFLSLAPLYLNFHNGDSSSATTFIVPVFNLFELLEDAFPNGDPAVCFTAVSTTSSDLMIIGESWLRNTLLLFDSANEEIGWIHVNCTTGRYLNPLTAQQGQLLTTFVDISSPPGSPQPPHPPPVAAITPPPIPPPHSLPLSNLLPPPNGYPSLQPAASALPSSLPGWPPPAAPIVSPSAVVSTPSPAVGRSVSSASRNDVSWLVLLVVGMAGCQLAPTLTLAWLLLLGS